MHLGCVVLRKIRRTVWYTPTGGNATKGVYRQQDDGRDHTHNKANQSGLTHCAAAVAIAAPATPRPHPNMSTGSSTRFTAPTTIALFRPALGSPIPLISCDATRPNNIAKHIQKTSKTKTQQKQQRWSIAKNHTVAPQVIPRGNRFGHVMFSARVEKGESKDREVLKTNAIVGQDRSTRHKCRNFKLRTPRARKDGLNFNF